MLKEPTQKDLIVEHLTDHHGIDFSADFHTLGSAKVEALLTWAGHYGYREPKHASGSRARYFFQMLAKHAAKQVKA